MSAFGGIDPHAPLAGCNRLTRPGICTLYERNRVPAVGYDRTSSATNVGADKDSEPRQRRAIEGFARRAGFDLVAWFYDPAVSGADPIETRAYQARRARADRQRRRPDR